MSRLLIPVLCISACVSNAMQIQEIGQSSLYSPHTIGNIKVIHDDEGFHVIKNDVSYIVKSSYVDPLLAQVVKNNKLQELLKIAYIAVNKTENGEFTLKALALT